MSAMRSGFRAALCAAVLSSVVFSVEAARAQVAVAVVKTDDNANTERVKKESRKGVQLLIDGKYEEALRAFNRCVMYSRAKAAQEKHKIIISTAPYAVREIPSRQGGMAPFAAPDEAEDYVRLLQSTMGLGDKAGCEELLAKIERLIPEDPRIIWMQRAVAYMPGPKNLMALDLGDGVELEMVLIRPGSFIMGADDGDPGEKPPHRVTISKPFHIGKYKVTQKQWETIMGNNPSFYKGPRNPVESVNWNECQEFIDRLNKKFADQGIEFGLPTSAQREYACRAGSTTRFHFGDYDSQLHHYAWFSLNADGRTHPVGEKKPNAWGLYDMHGNTWEICSDYYDDNCDYYSQSPPIDPRGASPGWARMLRGGSYSASVARCRSASRFPCNPEYRVKNTGLRLICTSSENE